MIMKLCAVVFLLLSVAFLTLLERKILGLSQFRISVNKVGFVGIFQPLLDGLKLFIKEFKPLPNNLFILCCLGPIFMFGINTSLLVLMFTKNTESSNYSFLWLLVILGMTIFGGLITGLMSNNKYSLIGAVRMAVQSICLEINISIVIYAICFMEKSLEMKLYFLLFLPLIISWFTLCLLETMHSPFDLGESESELVSGYNTEYSSTSFILLFLSEYSVIIILSGFTALILFNQSWLVFVSMLFCFMMIRSVFVRPKIDTLIYFSWFKLAPINIFLLFLCL